MSEIYDITVIGGGPAGMFAGFYAGLRNAKVQIIESLSELGGQVAALYPEKIIRDIGGFPAIKGRDLVTHLEKQLQTFNADIKLKQTVTNVQTAVEGFKITTAHEETVTKAITIATGVGALTQRKLAVSNSAAFEGKYLLHSVKDFEHFRNHKVLVAGCCDSAIDDA